MICSVNKTPQIVIHLQHTVYMTMFIVECDSTGRKIFCSVEERFHYRGQSLQPTCIDVSIN